MGMEEIGLPEILALEAIKNNPEKAFDAVSDAVNASFLDTANIIGKLNKNGLISYEEPFIGEARISLSEKGESFLKSVNEESEKELDLLDLKILGKLAEGEMTEAFLSATLARPVEVIGKRLYKLIKKGFIDYRIRGDRVRINLNEEGRKILLERAKGRIEIKKEKKEEKKEKKEEKPKEKLEREEIELVLTIPWSTRLKAKLLYYLGDWNFILKLVIAVLLTLIVIKLYWG